MSRSSKKGPYVDPRLLEKIAALAGQATKGSKTVIKTWSRDSEISPEMIGYTMGVHNGKDFIEVFVTEEMIGHKLGEFSPTRKFIRHGGKIQKDLEVKAKEAEKTAAVAAKGAK